MAGHRIIKHVKTTTIVLFFIFSPFVERVLPRSFSTKIQSDIEANATNVPLKEVSSHFYSLGSKISTHFPEQRLSDLLYKVRARQVSFVSFDVLDFYWQVTTAYEAFEVHE